MKFKRLRGVTFLEVLIVIVILGIIAALIVMVMNKRLEQSRDAKRKFDVDLLSKPVREFQIEKNVWPNFLAETVIGGYLESLPEDPKYGPSDLGYKYTVYVANGKTHVNICATLEDPQNPDGKWCWRSESESASEVSASVASASPAPSASPGGGGGGGGGVGPYVVVPVIYFGLDTPHDLNAFKTEVDTSLQDIRAWYSEQLAGKTFNTLPAIGYRSPKTEAELASQYPGGVAMWYEGLPEAVADAGMNVCDNHKYYYFISPLNNVVNGAAGAENLGCAYVIPGTGSSIGHTGELLGGIYGSFDPNWPEWYINEEREARGIFAQHIGHSMGGSCPGGVCNFMGFSSAPSLMWPWWDYRYPDPARATIFFEDEKIKVLASPFIQ